MTTQGTTSVVHSDALSGVAAADVQTALVKMHAQDRIRVVTGAIKASSLHLISAADARKAKVRWTKATTVCFKG